MSLENIKEEIDLNLVHKINEQINSHAESKSYYALELVGLLSVPLFTLFVKMLELKLFNFWYYKVLFILVLSLFLLSLVTLLFSFIPKLTILKRKVKDKTVEQIFKETNCDYYNYQFWSKLKLVNVEPLFNILIK